MKVSVKQFRLASLIAASCVLLMPAFAVETSIIEPRGPLHGEISLDASPDPIAKCINDLTDAALAQDDNIKKINAYVDRFKGLKHAIVHRSKDALNYVILYKGTAQSSEASDVILDEKQKLKGRSSAEYMRQKLIDRTGLSVTQSILDMAMGLGNADSATGLEQVQSATEKLTSLVGKDKAHETRNFLEEMLKQNPVSEDTWRQKPWSISQKVDRQNYLVDLSVATDPVSQEIVSYLHKYNNVSKLNRGSQKLVRTTLGIASLSPTLVAPAAQAALFAWVMASGGSEEDKLLKEVYLAKALDSRNKSVSEKANLALEYYQMSLLTKNPALLHCCRSIVKQMAGDTNANGLLAEGAFVSQQPVKEEEISFIDDKPKKTKKKKRQAKTASSTIDNETATK